MQNIYRAWTEFNDRQSQVLKGPGATDFIRRSEQSSRIWKDQNYPKGENWKYVDFEHLPTTHFHYPNQDIPTEATVSDDFFVLNIKNFKTPQKIKRQQLPLGIELESELDFSKGPQKQEYASNPFETLAPSFFGLGFVLRISKDYDSSRPIKLVFNYDDFSSDKDLFLQQNVSVVVEAGAQAQIFTEVEGQQFSGLSNICFNFDLSPQSKINFYSREVGGAQSYFVMNLNAQVKDSALFRSFDVTLPSCWSRHNFSVQLQETKAQGELYGLYLNDKNNFVDHHTSINHWVGETESREDYRGILSEKAQAVFNGKVYIAPKASKANSEQINKNLMLSNSAEVDTKPELQIYNDDVKAAHGATVGQLNEEQKFYLQSRGYSNDQAARVLAKAFVFDLLEEEGEAVDQFYHSSLEQALSLLEELK